MYVMSICDQLNLSGEKLKRFFYSYLLYVSVDLTPDGHSPECPKVFTKTKLILLHQCLESGTFHLLEAKLPYSYLPVTRLLCSAKYRQDQQCFVSSRKQLSMTFYI